MTATMIKGLKTMRAMVEEIFVGGSRSRQSFSILSEAFAAVSNALACRLGVSPWDLLDNQTRVGEKDGANRVHVVGLRH